MTDNASSGKKDGMKSAYELALERMERQGIERPREDFGEKVKESIAEARRQAEAKLAEIEILHQGNQRKEHDPMKRMEAEENYRRDRRRIESELESKVERLRKGA